MQNYFVDQREAEAVARAEAEALGAGSSNSAVMVSAGQLSDTDFS